MKRLLLVASVLLSIHFQAEAHFNYLQAPPGGGVYTGVRINEVDPDQPGADAGEFIELYGDPNASLDGLVVVFFQGAANDQAYQAFDLDGYSLDSNGFFVLGNAGVASAQLNFPDNSLQNGADGIAIYVGDATSWSADEVATATDLVDAMVYGTDDPEDTGLIATLTPGQAQLNDTGNSAASFSRVPDGGEAMVTTGYVVQDITPGASNMPACQGATVSMSSGQPEQCIEDINDEVIVITTSEFGASYIFILTNENDTIISYNTTGIFDMDQQGIGTFHIYGFAYNGILDEATVAQGMPVMDVAADICSSLSSNFATVVRSECAAPVCDGGNVMATDNQQFITVCIDEDADEYSFMNDGTSELSYAYFLLDEDMNILEIIEGPYDFNTLSEGTYYIGGLSYDGAIDPSTTEDGDAFTGISTTGGTCTSFSENTVQVNTTECEVVEGCTELYFSEYIEGSANNKAFEIYNPTPFPANLDDYDVLGYFNGSLNQGPVIALSGMLGPGETFVVANSQASTSLLNLADLTGGIATFNGNDALVLTHNLVPIDIIGEIGVDPGTAWVFGDASTSNMTLRRKPQVTSPTTNWVQSQGQWLVNAIDDFSNVGSHTTFTCSDLAFIGFTQSVQSVDETVGTVTVSIQSFNVSAPVEITVDLTAASATIDEDFQGTFPVTLTFDAENTFQSFTVDILDDDIMEVYEYFTMAITVDEELATLVTGQQTITIEPSDQAYPLYTIEQITEQTDVPGVADSLGVFCTISGIVHGINFNGDGIHFTLIEGDAGIKIFDADEDFGYTVAEGDSVKVKGEVTQFMGMTEFYPDSVFYLNGGHPLETPQLITTAITEEQESRMVRFECLELIDPSQWTNEESGFYVDVTDGTNDFIMHIDLDTDIYGTDPLTGHFSATGIGAQFDTTGAPYDQGYNFWPRYLEDIYEQVTASFVQFGDIVYGDDGVSISFFNTSGGETSYDWDFGDGTTSDEEFPNKFYSYAFLSTVSEVTITLTVENAQGCSDTFVYTTDAVYVGIEEIEGATILMYPNPATDIVHMKGDQPIQSVQIINQLGSIVFAGNNIGNSNFDLSLDPFATGVYQVRIETAKGVEIQKLVIR